MSSDLIAQLKAQLVQLGEQSSLNYSLGQTPEGNPVILAGDFPVFRCRAGELGEAHAQLVVAAIPALTLLLGGSQAVAPCAPRATESSAPCASDVAAVVKERIVSAISLQPELAPKAGLMAKLIFAAVEPFVAGQQLEQAPVRGQPGPAAAPQVDALRQEVSESLVDWLSSNASFPLSEEAFANAIVEWEASNAT
ncbi:hypothetical protein ACRCPS_17900 [Pseudomonas aeruginosa]